MRKTPQKRLPPHFVSSILGPQFSVAQLTRGIGLQLCQLVDERLFPIRRIMPRSVYLRSMHPKTEIAPTRAAIEKMLRAGWAGQLKIHGHRAQIHIHADPSEGVLVYNRHGRLHKKLLPDRIADELRRIVDLDEDWTVLDGEWIKPEDRFYLFDFLKLNGKLLNRMNYKERYSLLPRSFISPHVQTLPLFVTIDKCLEALARPEEYIEGLVFKSLSSPGFADTSVVRCRKKSVNR